MSDHALQDRIIDLVGAPVGWTRRYISCWSVKTVNGRRYCLPEFTDYPPPRKDDDDDDESDDDDGDDDDLSTLDKLRSKFVKKRQRQFDRWLQRTSFDTYERDFDSYDAYRCVDGPESDEDDTVPDDAGPCLVGRGNGSTWEAYNWIRKKKLFSKKMVCPVLKLSNQLFLLYLKKKKKKMLKVRSLYPKKKKKKKNNKWSTARLYNLKKKKIKKSAAWKSG